MIWAQETTTTITEAVTGAASFDWQAAAVGLGGVLIGLVALWLSWMQGGRQERMHDASLKSEEKRHAERLGSEEGRHVERLESEERVHADRLAHERREAVKSSAAAAYVDAKEYLGVVRRVAVNGEMREEPAAVVAKVRETYHDLAVITALGWSEPVRTAAAELGMALRQSAEKAALLIDAIGRRNGVAEAGERWLAGDDVAIKAAEAYRKALTEDDGGDES